MNRATWMRHILLAAIVAAWAAPALAQDFRQATPPEDVVGAKPSPTYPEPRGQTLRVADVVVLAGMLAGAAYIILRVRSRRWLVGVVAATVVYFGFYRGGCVCPIGSIQNVVQSLADPAYSISIVVTAIFLLPIVAALFLGRVFCGGVCWLGGVQDLLLRAPLRVPMWLDKPLRYLRWVYLALAVYFVLGGMAIAGLNLHVDRDYLICRYDPFINLFRLFSYRAALRGDWANAFHFTGPAWMWGVTGGILALAVFVGRPYCRWLCPYGAILGVCSRGARRGVTVMPEECCECGLCENACPLGAIEERAAVKATCLACARCYRSCPMERERIGLPVPEFIPAEAPAVLAAAISPARAPVRGLKVTAADDQVELDYLDELVARWGKEPSAALPLLQAIQERHRYLPRPALEKVCRLTDLKMSQLLGIGTFYNQFRLMPIGEHLIRVCHGTACHVSGARRINDAVRLHLGIPADGDTDAARKFTLQEVACLGCCSLAPVMQIDHLTFGHLTGETACKAIDSVREGRIDTDGHGDAKGGGAALDEVGHAATGHAVHGHAHPAHGESRPGEGGGT